MTLSYLGSRCSVFHNPAPKITPPSQGRKGTKKKKIFTPVCLRGKEGNFRFQAESSHDFDTWKLWSLAVSTWWHQHRNTCYWGNTGPLPRPCAAMPRLSGERTGSPETQVKGEEKSWSCSGISGTLHINAYCSWRPLPGKENGRWFANIPEIILNIKHIHGNMTSVY